MSSENWDNAESIFHQALDLPSDERRSFIARQCSGNERLISEIESLIFAFENEAQFLDEPVFNLGLRVFGEKPGKSLTDSAIGFYQVREKLGSGGMGEVYKALDTKLNRAVALKFLSEPLVDDKWAKRQLVKEAQAVAMLEHPNICAVHGIEETDKYNFIVMQYVEGKTLADDIRESSPSGERVIQIARQITVAVAVAHSHGVIHRDLKPGNIMITGDGQIKVLDFGLAKVIQQKQKIEPKDNSSRFSQNGLIRGTVSYMSPEQLRGEKLDYRTDIFSVGIIFYELIAKQNPFNKKSQAETIAAILNNEPFSLFHHSEPKIPDGFKTIIEKCLQKDANKRFQSAAEILVEIDKLNFENSPQPISALATARRSLTAKLCAAFLLLLMAFASLFYYHIQRPRPTLAVLPILNESQASENDYLAAGLTQNLIEEFSNLSGLKVVQETLTSRYRGREIDFQKVGEEVNADNILVGSIIKSADGLILKTQLIRTSDNFVLGTNQYPIKESELLNVTENIPSRIVAQMKSDLTEEDKAKLAKKPTENPEALRLYFLGRFYWKRRGKDDLKTAIQYFTQATNLDPYYAKAWSGLADSYAFFSVPGYSGSISSEEAVKLTKAAAKNALEIDNNLCEPFASLGWVQIRFEWNWAEAENYFRASLERNPEFAPAHLGLSHLLTITGRFDQALEEARKTKELDPFSTNSDLNLARVYYYRRDYEKMKKILSEALEKEPDNKRLSYILGFAFLQTGEPKEATAVFEKIYETDKLLGAASLGYVYAKTGRKNDALKILADLNEFSKENYVSPQERAFIYLGLGDKDKLFASLASACAERYPALPYLSVDPLFDEIRTDARFSEIKKCVNL